MKKNSFLEGTVIATVALFVTKLLGIIYLVPFYSIVGPKGSALYGYAYNVYAIFLEISIAGIPIAMSKIINEYKTLGMDEAKLRTFKLARKMLGILSVISFTIIMIFAKELATVILGNLEGGNTIEDAALVIRSISFAILIIPYLSVSKGFLQGHSIITAPSIANIIEQAVRIGIIIFGAYLSYRVFDLELSSSVAICLTGAFIGGLSAYVYLKNKINHNKELLNIKKDLPKDNVTDKEIIKKIIRYAIPFIVTSIATSIYAFVDMVLILRTLNHLNYTALQVEFITNAMTTLAPKLKVIVGALATGMTVSLMPAIVSAFVKKDLKEVNNKINKAFEIILVISLPMIIGLCLIAKPIWTVFYGVSKYGPIVFRFSVWTSLFANLFTISSTTLQSMNKFKIVYLSTILGIVVNALLDVPLMLLFDYIGIYPFYGATLATIIGYSLSVFIAVRRLKKEIGLSISSTLTTLKKTIIPLLAMIVVVVLVLVLLPYNTTNRVLSLLYGLLITVLGATTYITLAYKNGLLIRVFGKIYLNKIIKKLTFNKVSIKD